MNKKLPNEDDSNPIYKLVNLSLITIFNFIKNKVLCINIKFEIFAKVME